MGKLKLKNKPKKAKPIYDPLLYGNDPEENIVAVEPIPDEPQVEVFIRENGRLRSRIDHCKAFFYTNKDEPLLDDLWDDQTQIWALEGDLHYDTMVETNNIRASWWFKKNAQKGNWWAVRERGQYLLSTGKTLFKGMDFDDPVRLYFDLETYTTSGYKFTNPERPGDKILIISIITNRGHRIALVLDEDDWSEQWQRPDDNTDYVFLKTEQELIRAFFYLIEDIDPDVFIAHHGFNFDLWFLHQRCRLLDIKMAMGRDGKLPNVYDSTVAIGEKNVDIKCFEFYGRHVLDTEIMARQIDIVKRKFENYQLKYLIKEIGEENEDRIIVPGARISQAWDNKDPEYSRGDLISYAVADSEDVQKLDRTFGRGIFQSTQFTPYPYQDVMRLATGGKSNTLFVRYYYHNNHSLPKPEKIRSFSGGYAGVERFGYIDKGVVLADVKSLYPSLGIELNIQPKSDVLGYYQKVIRLFRNMRYKIKDQIEGADEKKKQELKATDGQVKIYLNTISYGYLTSPFSLFNDYDEGERITTEGQKVLKKAIDFIQKNNGQPLKFDTDGCHFIPPKKYSGNFDNEIEFINQISDSMPKNIEIGMDGRYQSMLVVDGKSYATKDYDGKYTIKGDTLKSRRKEHFILEHLDTCVKAILDGNLTIMEQSFYYWKNRIESGQIKQHEVIQYQELKEPLETYKTKVELGAGNGGRNPDAAYEIACQKVANGFDIKVGDRIEYYVAASPMTAVIDGRNGQMKFKEKYKKVYQLAKDIDEFEAGNIHIDHYMKRLRKSSAPLFMLFYSQKALKDKFGIKLYKKRRDKMDDIHDKIYNEFIL